MIDLCTEGWRDVYRKDSCWVEHLQCSLPDNVSSVNAVIAYIVGVPCQHSVKWPQECTQ